MCFMKEEYFCTGFFFVLVISCFNLFSTPDLSLQTGNKCTKCHINPQGGGVRTEFGWKFLRDASHFSIGVDKIKKIYELFDKETYNVDIQLGDSLNGKTFSQSFAYGMDFRLQSVRSHKTEFAKRRIFPMELGLYIVFSPFKNLSFNGQFNPGPIIFQGQDNWMASANLKFDDFLPEIQIGKFQPSFGIRDCDMTKFDRRIASVDYSSSLFPPDYSEFGIEISYRTFEYFDVYLGAFDSRFLSQVTIFGNIPIVFKHNPSFNLKLVFYPQLSSDFLIYSFLGTSFLKNGNFFYSSSFVGMNLLETFSLLGEYAYSELKEYRKTMNYLLRVYFHPFRGITPFLAFETAKTNLSITPKSKWELENQSAILGIKYFPVPYLETLVEYRYFKSTESKSTRWAFQLHLYY